MSKELAYLYEIWAATVDNLERHPYPEEVERFLAIEKALTPPTKEETKKYIDDNFELLVHFPFSISEKNGKYFMSNFSRKEISPSLVVALIKEVKDNFGKKL